MFVVLAVGPAKCRPATPWPARHRPAPLPSTSTRSCNPSRPPLPPPPHTHVMAPQASADDITSRGGLRAVCCSANQLQPWSSRSRSRSRRSGTSCDCDSQAINIMWRTAGQRQRRRCRWRLGCWCRSWRALACRRRRSGCRAHRGQDAEGQGAWRPGHSPQAGQAPHAAARCRRRRQ